MAEERVGSFRERLISGIDIGHCFGLHFHRIGLSFSMPCVRCKEQEESVSHLRSDRHVQVIFILTDNRDFIGYRDS